MRATSRIDRVPDHPLGRYQLLALLGQGGMADVYLACTQGPGGFQKLLVVKLARFSGDPLLSRMFLDEARLAAQLSHPNVVQTFEVGEEASRHYIVMEYLDGATFSRLRQRASAHGGVPLRYSVQILCNVLDGLEYAHNAQGLDGKPLRVVHRDLTPSNIIVTAQGVTKILDFGIAKAADSYSFTQAGRYSGKLSYMPPEQLRAESVDERADLFALGVTLAESGLGHRFWGNTSEPLIASRLATNDIPSIRDRGELDPELLHICSRALAPDREQRYPSAAAFKADLTQYLAVLGGPVSQQELGTFVTTVAGEDRAKLQAIIDNQVGQLAKSSAELRAVSMSLPRLEPTPPMRSAVHSAATVRHEARPTTSLSRTAEAPVVEIGPAALDPLPISPPLRQAQPARHRLVLAAGLGAAALAAAGVVLLRQPAATTTPTAAPAALEPAALEPAAAPRALAAAVASPTNVAAPAAPTSVRLEVEVSPAQAAISLDGASLGANPYVGVVIRDPQIHELTVAADGYEPLRQRLTFDRDVILRLHLQPQRRTGASARPVGHARPRGPVATEVEPAPISAPPPRPAEARPAEAPAADKRALDTDLFDDTKQKRAIDADVFDQPAKPKASIDRDTPWQK